MNKRITQEQKEEVRRLYDNGKGLSIVEIVRQTGLTYNSVYVQTKLVDTIKQRTNPETGQPFTSLTDYHEHLARQRTNPETGQPFASLTELKDYQARQRTNPETGQPFASKGEYESYQARQRTNPETGQPFASLTELKDYQARQRTNPETGQPFTSLTDYHEHLARQRTNPETGKPFALQTEYLNHLAKRARRRKANKKLEELVNVSLRVLEKDLDWLAGEIGVSRQMAYLYSQGKNIPRPEILSKLFIALDAPFKTLDDLVNEDL